MNNQKAYFAGGCFWGVEYHFQKLTGVVSTRVGYMGGKVTDPTYKQVSNDDTGHAETVEITFNSEEITHEELVKHFFEIHDSTQLNKQGPDIGKQYRSAIFYKTNEEKETAQKVIDILKEKDFDVQTTLEDADKFWTAEAYHQKYFSKNDTLPYCHTYTKIF